MRRLMQIGLWTGAALVLLGFAATPVWAQDEGGVQQTSAFKMFFLPGGIMGVAITWFLILMSFVAISLVLLFVLRFRQSVMMPDVLVDDIEAMLNERKFRDAIETTREEESVFGQIMFAALSEASNGFAAMERAIEEAADLISSRVTRPLEYLNVLGATGPMLGLFGTVYGMIAAFAQLAAAGTSVKPAELADGISTALVTTFWGLIVGIPAVAGYALIRNKAEANIAEAMITSEELLSQFKPGAKKTAASAATASGPASAAAPKPTPSK